MPPSSAPRRKDGASEGLRSDAGMGRRRSAPVGRHKNERGRTDDEISPPASERPPSGECQRQKDAFEDWVRAGGISQFLALRARCISTRRAPACGFILFRKLKGSTFDHRPNLFEDPHWPWGLSDIATAIESLNCCRSRKETIVSLQSRQSEASFTVSSPMAAS